MKHLDNPFRYVFLSFRNIKEFFSLLLFGKVRDLGENASNSFEVSSFNSHYYSNILPALEEFERQRVEVFNEIRLRLLLILSPFAIIFLGILVFYYHVIVVPSIVDYDIDRDLFYLSVLAFVLILCAPIVIAKRFESGFIDLVNYAISPVREYINNIKITFFPIIIKFFGDNFSYERDLGKEMVFINSLKHEYSGLQPYIHPDKGAIYYGIYENNGFIQGEYKNNIIQIIETKLIRDSGKIYYKNRIYDVIFSGILILLTRDSNVSDDVVITIDEKDSQYIKGLKELKEVTGFTSNRVKIYTGGGGMEAGLLLTDNFILKLKEVRDIFGGSGISAAFYENKLLIRIPMKKLFFETTISEPVTMIDDSNRFLRVMNKIFDIMDVV